MMKPHLVLPVCLLTATFWSAWVQAQTPVPSPSAATVGAAASSGPTYTLAQLLDRARTESPLLAVVRSEEEIAKAAVTTARAYPNPEIEVGPGRLRPRTIGASGGTSPLIGIVQPIENPRLRAARTQVAESRVNIAVASSLVSQTEVLAEVRDRFSEVVRLREQASAFREDVALTELIRSRVQVRVRSGEAPRFDLVRAESEVAIARKNADTAELQARQALNLLRQAVSVQLEDNFEIVPQSGSRLTQADFEALRSSVQLANPLIRQAEAELQRSQEQVTLERAQVIPQVNLSLVTERDPSVTLTRLGANVVVPLWNRREGPIAEARAQVVRNQLAKEQRQFEIQTAVQAAWSGYEAALARVTALESGIIDRARTAVEIAEAAYRFGERGILEFLDAQRQFRLVRNELIEARYNLNLARNELDRLAGR
jgi:cobalt-zinc-cadmium efflux system outer membrane protein